MMRPMLEETGTIVAQEGEDVLVEVLRRSACGQCNSHSACGVSVVAGLFSTEPTRIRVRNHLNAAKGERVVIGLPATTLLLAALVVYLLPLLAMVIIAAGMTAGGFENTWIIPGSFFGMLAALWLGHYLARKRFIISQPALLRRYNDSSMNLANFNT